MESVELKLRGIDSSEFVVRYTKNIVERLGEPELSLEVKDGKTSEDISRFIESLGYHIKSKRPMDGWIGLKAVKQNE
jgi:hypothetical protein